MKDIPNKDSQTISSLLEKYFEGQTSLKEEQLLRDYFRQPQIDAQFESLRPLFQYFSEERELLAEEATPSAGRRYHLPLRWVSVAAACLLLLVGLRVAFPEPVASNDSYVDYVDGERFTDIKLLQEKLLLSLETFSRTDEIISSQIDALDSFTDLLLIDEK